MVRKTRLPNPPASSAVTTAYVRPAPGPGNEGAVQLGMDVTRTILNASLSASHGMLKFMEQMQEAQAQAFRGMEKTLSSAITEADKATDLQDLVTLQGKMMQANLAGAAENFSSLLTRWCEAEAEFVEQAQTQTAGMTRKLVEDGSTGAKGDGADQGASSVLDLLGSAQAAWTQLSQQWVDAVKESSTQH